MRLFRTSTAGALLFGTSFAGTALAAGTELLPGGNQSVARGGAVAARAEDPMVLANDPAGLALLEGNQIILDLVTPIPHMCVDPYGYYGWGAYGGSSEFGDSLSPDYANAPLPKVCNSAKVATLPDLAYAGKLSKNVGVGFGFVAPVLLPGMQYGGSDGTMNTPNGPRPTPTRYSLVKQEVPFALNPTAGIGYRPIPQIAVGLQVQVLMVKARATAVQNAVSGTQPSSDWLATLETRDYFVPSVTASLHTKPVKPVDLVVAFKYTENFDGAGSVTYETNTFHHGAKSGPVPYGNAPIPIADIQVGMPWQLTFAARYAQPLRERKLGGLGDPMDTELWDVEADFGYQLAGIARNSIDVGGDATVYTREAGTSLKKTTAQNLGATAIDPHRKTAYQARLGGSYSVVPQQFQVDAGTFWESRSVDPEYADIDSFAFQRVGLGLGGVVRIGSFDLRFAYSHIFSETLDVRPPAHQNVENANPNDPTSGFDQRVGGTFGPDGVRQGGTVLPDPAAQGGGGDATARKTQVSAISTNARPERVINAGKYTASFDVISLGVVYHF
ncbi:MAG TPA: hypothetical protein VHE30_30615 [Polyangiaceae bacterium]|nr:hypothetical protein [Polyangiaceae bacterium]